MVATVMYDKSGLYLPFYRQEKDWGLQEVPLPRETIGNWYNRCSLDYLSPIYDALHEKFLGREVTYLVAHYAVAEGTDPDGLWSLKKTPASKHEALTRVGTAEIVLNSRTDELMDIHYVSINCDH